MIKTNYILTQVPYLEINPSLTIDQEITSLVSDFSVNSLFDSKKHTLTVEIYSLDNTLLYRDNNYLHYTQRQGSEGAGRVGASQIDIDPVEDIKRLGYEQGDVNIGYRFLNNPFTDKKIGEDFFIDEISSDRTEYRAYSLTLTDQELQTYADNFRNRLQNENSFSEYYVEFTNGQTSLGINVDTEQTNKGLSLLVKILNPLPASVGTKSTFNIFEKVSDNLAYNITTEITEEIQPLPTLKGPNFNVDAFKTPEDPTQYLNYTQLFSYPVTGSYYELFSLFNEKSVNISIDHSNYSDFIHFSSAEERLRNFKYKLDLIHSYEDSLNLISGSMNSVAASSGSREHYQKLIEGIVNNFDHYDRFLYYESSSFSWPKTTTTRPHINRRSTDSIAVQYFNSQLVSSSNFDSNNEDALINTIPSFLRDDPNNEPYLMFIYMIGQHFDNLWIYFKAVTDKYDTDNRLNFGISKDIVKSAVESFGINLATSNVNTDNLFSMFTGEGIVTGSEIINTQYNILSGSGNEILQPVPQDNYQKEIYKRIYHNIPYLVKTKGSQRGLRALINCYGIPDDILSIKTFGGVDTKNEVYLSPLGSKTGSIDSIRLDVTGSILTGSTLSKYSSIVDKTSKFSDDQHTVEIGFDISENTNKYIRSVITSSFNIDNYIGDPTNRYESSYNLLDKYSENILLEGIDKVTQTTFTNDPFAFIRMVRFFDTSLFRTIKQFLPARSNVSTGVIVKPHILDRSKSKQVEVSWEFKTFTGSLQTGFIEGENGGSFPVGSTIPYTTNYSASYVTPLGRIDRNVTTEEPKITGEFSGSLLAISDGELNRDNPFKRSAQPNIIFDITAFNLSLPIPPPCDIIFTGTYEGEFFRINTSNTSTGTIRVTYPSTIGPTTGPISYIHDYDTYEYFNVEATPVYPETFTGWYNISGSLITTSNILTVYYEDESSYGYSIEARFN